MGNGGREAERPETPVEEDLAEVGGICERNDRRRRRERREKEDGVRGGRGETRRGEEREGTNDETTSRARLCRACS